MNEIEKLKTEHARYKAALELLSIRTFSSSYVPTIASEALNPPPPAPVTLDELKTALAIHNRKEPISAPYSICFFRDESGAIHDIVDNRVFSFCNLREAVEFLNRRSSS